MHQAGLYTRYRTLCRRGATSFDVSSEIRSLYFLVLGPSSLRILCLGRSCSAYPRYTGGRHLKALASVYKLKYAPKTKGTPRQELHSCKAFCFISFDAFPNILRHDVNMRDANSTDSSERPSRSTCSPPLCCPTLYLRQGTPCSLAISAHRYHPRTSELRLPSLYRRPVKRDSRRHLATLSRKESGAISPRVEMKLEPTVLVVIQRRLCRSSQPTQHRTSRSREKGPVHHKQRSPLSSGDVQVDF